NLKTNSEVNDVANLWIQHLIQRIIVEQLDIPPRLQSKILYKKRGNTKNEDIKSRSSSSY
ncbi:hypothetical protein, partial [Priestia flexa]